MSLKDRDGPHRMPDRARLEADVRALAAPRHPRTSPDALRAAEDHVAREMGAAGLRVERQLFTFRGAEYHNVLGTLDGRDAGRPWVVVGAHFDSVPRSPGADDNASGVAAMLEVARLLGRESLGATVQFVGFNLEEIQDYLGSFRIGSREYARSLRQRSQPLAGALVLEMLAFTGPRQVVPAAVRLVKKVPRVGDFLAAIGDGGSAALLAAFERAAGDAVPLVTIAVPLKGWLVPDTRRSDNARFWDEGYRALMLTDTAELRNPNYHRESDTPETLDYGFLQRATLAVVRAVEAMAA